MARTSSVNLLSETQRLELIAEAVRYCQKVKVMGMPAAAYSKALREPIYFLWERRSGKAKYACPGHRSKVSIGLVAGAGQLVYDHAIPFRYLQEKLLAINGMSLVAVRSLLEQYCHAAVITKEEDNRLNRAGLGSKMPYDWDGRDPLARYKVVGIELVENPDSI